MFPFELLGYATLARYLAEPQVCHAYNMSQLCSRDRYLVTKELRLSQQNRPAANPPRLRVDFIPQVRTTIHIIGVNRISALAV